MINILQACIYVLDVYIVYGFYNTSWVYTCRYAHAYTSIYRLQGYNTQEIYTCIIIQVYTGYKGIHIGIHMHIQVHTGYKGIIHRRYTHAYTSTYRLQGYNTQEVYTCMQVLIMCGLL